MRARSRVLLKRRPGSKNKKRGGKKKRYADQGGPGLGKKGLSEGRNPHPSPPSKEKRPRKRKNSPKIRHGFLTGLFLTMGLSRRTKGMFRGTKNRKKKATQKADLPPTLRVDAGTREKVIAIIFKRRVKPSKAWKQ